MIMNLKAQIIDNNFFRVSAAQAKWLTINQRLPRPGYQSKADPARLASMELYDSRGNRMVINNVRDGWVQQTMLGYHQGKTIKTGVVWAVHVNWK